MVLLVSSTKSCENYEQEAVFEWMRAKKLKFNPCKNVSATFEGEF